MSSILNNPETRKWAVLGIKAVITALAVLPQLRQQSERDVTPMKQSSDTNSNDAPVLEVPPGLFGLLFLDERGEVLSSYRFHRDVVNQYRVDRDEIQRVSKDAEAYAAVITYDRNVISSPGTLTLQKVVPHIADALSDAGVRVFQRAFMPKDNHR